MHIYSRASTDRPAFYISVFLLMFVMGNMAQAACTPNPDVAKLYPALAQSECKLVGTTQFKNVAIQTYQDTQMPVDSAKIFRNAIAEASVKAMASFSSLKPGIEYHAVQFVISPKADIGGVAGVPAVQGVSNSDICIITLNGDINILKMEGGGKASDFPALFGESPEFLRVGHRTCSPRHDSSSQRGFLDRTSRQLEILKTPNVRNIRQGCAGRLSKIEQFPIRHGRRVLRSEARLDKGNRMRTLVEPPPSARCNLCGGELRLMLIEPTHHAAALDNEIFVCAGCRREHSYTVSRDPRSAAIRG